MDAGTIIANSEAMAAAINAFFLLTMAIVVFSMQLGFTLLEAGGVRRKNVNNILTKNFLDCLAGAFAYYSVGFALSYGKGNGFMGYTNFFLTEEDTDYSNWVFQFFFAATAATIVSGAVAERVSFEGYLSYSIVLTAFLYPIATHWVWSDDAWLTNLGFKDFAGSTVVHVAGGSSALQAAWILGPRIGRFMKDGTPNPNVRGHSLLLSAAGGMLLWVGFLAFNGGSLLTVVSVDPETGLVISHGMKVAEIYGVSIMSGSAGGLTVLLVGRTIEKKWLIGKMINGSLAGLVSICACADEITFYNAFLVGIVGGFFYDLASRGLLRIQVDDPVDAIPVHFAGGVWGTIATGLFRIGDSVFYNGNFKFLGIQVLGTLVIAAWCTVVMGTIFFILNKLNMFRVSREYELAGLDILKHGEAAYAESWLALNFSQAQLSRAATTGEKAGVSPGMINRDLSRKGTSESIAAPRKVSLRSVPVEGHGFHDVQEDRESNKPAPPEEPTVDEEQGNIRSRPKIFGQAEGARDEDIVYFG